MAEAAHVLLLKVSEKGWQLVAMPLYPEAPSSVVGESLW